MEQSQKILIIEDDPSICIGLKINLEIEKFQVEVAHNGLEGLSKIQAFQPDLILLDIMLPDMNGFEILKSIREHNVESAVIMLTAKGLENDKVLGLELGADDYVQKPFSIIELIARIRANLRRQQKVETSFTFADIVVYFEEQKVMKSNQEVVLSTGEYKLLKLFISHQNKSLSREKILNSISASQGEGNLRSIDNFIASLRKKLEKNHQKPEFFLTIRGRGYLFKFES